MNRGYISLFATDDFIYGLITLMYSWKNTNPKYPFYLIVTKNVSDYNKKLAQKLGYILLESDNWMPQIYLDKLIQADENDTQFLGENNKDLSANGWQHCGAKIQIFKMTDFEKLVYLDADTWVFQNLDDLFERPHMSSVLETLSGERKNPHFNAGILVIEPNRNEYLKIKNYAETFELEGRLATEMDVLNSYYSNWFKNSERVLPFYYHGNGYYFHKQHESYTYYNGGRIKAIHMIGKKPWRDPNYMGTNVIDEGKFYQLYYYIYQDFLSWCLKDLADKEIAHLPLITPIA